jgi:glycerol-3-phosphate O-acyltransferase
MGDPGLSAGASADGAATGLPAAPHPSSMSQRLGWVHRLLSRYAFAFVHVDSRLVERIRQLGALGTVVYVMRNRSVADYLLIRAVFLREGVPLPQFANDLSIGWFRPLRWICARIIERVSRLQLFGQRKRRRLADLETAVRLVGTGSPILIFLRARSSGLVDVFQPERARESKRIGAPYLEELLGLAAERPVFLVPLAPFRGRGYRKRSSRLATLVYSVREAPNELKKLLTFLFNRRDLSLTIGEAIELRQFLGRYSVEGPRSMVRRLTRVLQLFLYREERVVWGPPLLPKRVVCAHVLGQPALQETIARVAAGRAAPVDKVRGEAEGYFGEMAANFNGTYFALLAFAFRRIWNRIFRGVEITGLDGVAQCIREHPVVLVPCHRSHFDYLILSYIFHSQFLSPPHIAAGINLSFFPMGMLFRGAGAFFIRRSFGDDELYKAVFREYLAFLIREGYTQEFFIEGGRSRTGKILTPKLGMLSAIVNAFLCGARRDLYLVPVSITYERLVEEEAYKHELLGAEKQKENLRALLRARVVLRANYGKAFVNFADPISLARALGGLRSRFRETPDDPAVEQEVRRFILKLGFRLLADVNTVSVVSAPSLAATVLLSNPYPAIRVAEFLRSAHFLLGQVERLGAHLTGSLHQDRRTFQETLAFLETSGLVTRMADGDGGILQIPDDKRINLDFYKNNSIHWFLVLSLVAHALGRGVRRDALEDDLSWWFDLFRNEFVVPERDELSARIGKVLDTLAALGAIREGGIERAHPLLRLSASILQNFREAYWVATKTLGALDASGKPQSALVEEMRRAYRVNLLLGTLRKPEGNTTVALGNAINRMQELRCIAFDTRGRESHWIVPGSSHAELTRIEQRLADSIAEPTLLG